MDQLTRENLSQVTISVATTTFQGEKYLSEQLASFVTQTRLPDEIVIGDDASTDDTWSILRAFEEASPVPVRLLRGDTNRGLNRNIEAVVAACTGDVIVLADQDDVWSTEKLAVIAAAFRDPDVMLWFSDAELIDPEGRPMGTRAWERVAFHADQQRLVRSGAGLLRLIHGMTVTGATMAVRSSVARLGCPLPARMDQQDPPFLHDGWLAALAVLLGQAIVELRPLTLYRQHADQVAGLWREAPTAPGAGKTKLGRRFEAARRRHAQLGTDLTRVTLVADRLRERGVIDRCRPDALAELLALEEFLEVRALPRRTRGRARRILRLWTQGRYAQYARGLPTAMADLIR